MKNLYKKRIALFLLCSLASPYLMSFSSVSYGVESTPNLGESITTKTNLPSQLKAEDLQNIITVNEQFEETLENEEY